MLLEDNIHEMELSREAHWSKNPRTSAVKLRWRALQVRHCFHVLPGEAILELGAGTGLWTEHLTSVLRGENPITAAVLDDELHRIALAKELPNTEFVRITDLNELPAGGFDYVVGTDTLCHNQYPQNLNSIYRLLKPGGQFLFFEANRRNPVIFVKNSIRLIGRWAGDARCQVGLSNYKLLKIASQQGFSNIEIAPFDIFPSRTPHFFIQPMQSIAFILAARSAPPPSVRHTFHLG